MMQVRDLNTRHGRIEGAAAGILPTVRRLMEFAGLAVEDRGMPRIVLENSNGRAGAYHPHLHRVSVTHRADVSTLAHELCHALQPQSIDDEAAEVPTDSDDPRYDAYRWSRDEREAFAIQAIYRYAECDPRWLTAAENLQGAGIDALEYMVGITGTATKRHGRRARITANAAKRAAGLEAKI